MKLLNGKIGKIAILVLAIFFSLELLTFAQHWRQEGTGFVQMSTSELSMLGPCERKMILEKQGGLDEDELNELNPNSDCGLLTDIANAANCIASSCSIAIGSEEQVRRFLAIF